ncbi:MAG: NAD(P)H-hydrate epimerase [Candidatus Hodarchaeota archaeon]
MVLPGITKEQMEEVDRLMIEKYHIPVELMMEHAGINLARLVCQLTTSGSSQRVFHVIAGSGNNGGGGLVAARRLHSWGLKTDVFLPKGHINLSGIPTKQLNRVQKMGVKIFQELPTSSSTREEDSVVLDCYIGYGFSRRSDKISEGVFEYLRGHKNVISLDTPSGLDVTTGDDVSKIQPQATLTIAFVKEGLLRVPQEAIGKLYIVDIGVPTRVYRSEMGINWSQPFDISYLDTLEKAFQENPIQKVLINQEPNQGDSFWKIG